ncbi:hypothetical protein [Chryseobacterium gregarium]|uniref:hypothetical protein n=1 Tax=Chryseobacterium gregarium TaxID=456299 RepID=UPI0004850A83|nr:hypothetical protein [Chryseobacterium gregarium]
MIIPDSDNLAETHGFPGFLRHFFGSSSGRLRKTGGFSEETSKKTRSGPEEMHVSIGHRLPKPAKTGHKLPKPVHAIEN